MMRKNVLMALPIITALLINYPGICQAQNADNTKINQRDKAPEELTADQQGQAKGDLEITQEIRKAIINEKSFSMDAHNVKIITKAGIVTLKGPVASAEEKNRIESIASQIVGINKIQNEMDIVSK